MDGKIRVRFDSGESRDLYYNPETDTREFKCVNFMIAHCVGGRLYEDDELYAEVVLPEGEEADSYYGYAELSLEIIHQCIEKGYSTAMLEFD